ncbi:hypothetical protein C461_04417 [Halorubrum aidingense JCM 13560]|uniref:C2H2-type domain-containing protein n=1 Tax=Halorubrum aidingense JCM 13560 TaxID=1230454 RepID=M0PGX6_9EURY|nr:hypothetical protein [Halorubrum aidingense]EMA68844.1 hypothetical protein C461_04417 [Halorubrum aidingense JCM 13560]
MSDDRTFTCTDCGAEISADVESTPKAFKFHVKREHRSNLQDLDSTRKRPYRAFLDEHDIEKIRDDDVPI